MEAEAFTTYISQGKLRGSLAAAFLISGTRSPKIHLILNRYRPVYSVKRDIVGGVETEVVSSDYGVFERDVRDGALAEMLAAQLLQPFKPLYGEDLLRVLELTYKKNVVRQLVKDLVSEHKIASLELRIKPEYFLFEKVRRLATVFPWFRRYFLEHYSLTSVGPLVEGFVRACEELVSEEILQRVDDYYSISKSAYEMLSRIPPIDPTKLSSQLGEYLSKPLITKAALKIFFNTAGDFVRTPVPPITSLPDPERYILISTWKGLQPLTFQLEASDLIKHLYGEAQFEIRRKGGALNSTYVLTVWADGVHTLFIKKYLNWTDLKWIAARIWAAGVKNFSINPATRLATEVFYLERLKEMGFKTPEVVHVNWRQKILFTTYLDGLNLLELWLREDEGRDNFAMDVGLCLARLHSTGVTIGDCKPETFMRVDGDIYITDLEQASFSGDRSWDLMELLFYPGHYLDVGEAAKYARAVVMGYLAGGEEDVVKGALKPRYLRVIAPWTSVWVQRSITGAVRSCLRV